MSQQQVRDALLLMERLEALNSQLAVRIARLEAMLVRRARLLALCMAAHPRLGEAAPPTLSLLPEEILRSLVA
jgi:hypothetical protein